MGLILFENKEYMLADFSDIFAVDLRLFLKKEQRMARIHVFIYNERSCKVQLELTSKHRSQQINYTALRPASDYISLREKLLSIRTPKDFVTNFLELISPQIAEVIK